MSKSDLVFTGEVIDIRPNISVVKVDDIDDLLVECTLAGKLRINHINIVRGDKVKIEVSPYDTKKGRIIYRIK